MCSTKDTNEKFNKWNWNCGTKRMVESDTTQKKSNIGKSYFIVFQYSQIRKDKELASNRLDNVFFPVQALYSATKSLWSQIYMVHDSRYNRKNDRIRYKEKQHTKMTFYLFSGQTIDIHRDKELDSNRLDNVFFAAQSYILRQKICSNGNGRYSLAIQLPRWNHRIEGRRWPLLNQV